MLSLGILKKGLNAIDILLFSRLINLFGDNHILLFFPVLQVSDVGSLTTRDEMNDLAVAEVFQNHINLLSVKSGLLCHQALIDIDIFPCRAA